MQCYYFQFDICNYLVEGGHVKMYKQNIAKCFLNMDLLCSLHGIPFVLPER